MESWPVSWILLRAKDPASLISRGMGSPPSNRSAGLPLAQLRKSNGGGKLSHTRARPLGGMQLVGSGAGASAATRDPVARLGSGPLAVDRWFAVRPGVAGSCWGTGRDSVKADHARWRWQSEAGRTAALAEEEIQQHGRYRDAYGDAHTDRSMGLLPAPATPGRGTLTPLPAPRAAGSAPPGAMSRRPRPRLCMQSETATRSPAASACCGTVPDCMPGQHIYREREYSNNLHADLSIPKRNSLALSLAG